MTSFSTKAAHTAIRTTLRASIRAAICASIAVGAAMGTAPALSAQTAPTAAEVIARYVAAIGGKDAIMKIKSYSSTGTMEVPAMGLTAPMEIAVAAPNKMVTKTSIPGLGELLNGSNGTVAWDVNPMAGPRLLADKELTQMKENTEFYANLLFSADRYSALESQGVVDFGGEKTHKLRMVLKQSGTESASFFSVATGLLVGTESSAMSQMGTVQITQVVSDYKTFGGVKMPMRIEQTIGPNKMILITGDVKLNAVPDSAFDIPAQIKPLIKP